MVSSSKIIRLIGAGAVGTLVSLGAVHGAGAATYPSGGESPTVTPTESNVSPNRASRPASLPLTGTDVAELAAIGGASIGVGIVMLRRSRRVHAA